MVHAELKKLILDKDPWQYECWQDGSEHYTCFWCDAVFDEYYEYKNFKPTRKYTPAIHGENCLYKILLDE